ncbi:hypothetical protein [Massilia sp. HP4]|uniref:hypothetical protein n=1 Tax=Massilia sp. HP4 TaxID=2562316 RepID=UPI0010C02752|nr:hypothetical protein [Massilia sp. HP4]
MSNPTELPDLNRLEALARAATPGPWKKDSSYTIGPVSDEDDQSYGFVIPLADVYGDNRTPDAAFIAAANPAAVLALITLARHAQPEGEAPQAEPVACVTDKYSRDGYNDEIDVLLPVGTKLYKHPPAAQHAESGAQGYRAALAEIADMDSGCAAAIAKKALAAQSQGAPALTPLDYRAQGREEALAVILGQSSEDPFSDCIGWSKSGAPEDEGGTYWKDDELRALLHIGDRKHDAYDRAEAAYWEALGRKDEAARELLFAQQAPFYKPLHDFLSKHEAWDLMGDLKRAQQAAAPGALADWKLVPDEPTDQMTYIGQKMRYDPVNSIGLIYCAMIAAAPTDPGSSPKIPDSSMSAAGAPEASCSHRNTTALYTHVVCQDCGQIKTDEAWGIASSKWFRSEYEAKFYKTHGCYPDAKRAAQLDGGQEGSESNG